MKVPSAMVRLNSGPGTRGQAVLQSRCLDVRRGGHCSGASYLHDLISSSLPRRGLCPPVKHDWTFQDRDTQFYRFPGPEPEPAGVHELEEELVEAMALLSQRGPDALLTVALRKS